MVKLGSTLDENSKKDKSWIEHRRNNVKVAEIYGNSGDPKCLGYAERMEFCAGWLEFGEIKAAGAVMEHDRKLKLTKAIFCKVRHCPVCAWRRSLAYIARFNKNLPEYLEQFPDFAYLYAVLTVRNPVMDELRETIRQMNGGLKKMLKRKEFLPVCKGFVKTIEVTRGTDGNPHPHINLCMAVNKSYFTDKTYLSHARWVELWRGCLGLDYDPVVNVKRITRRAKKGDATEADQPGVEISAGLGADLFCGMREVVKYSVKEADLVEDPEFLIGITHQLSGMRFIATSGCMKDILRNGDSDSPGDVEEVSESEMLLRGDESIDKITKWRQRYKWGYADSRNGNYYLTRRWEEEAEED